jgi:hypothetical protein
MLKYYVKTRDVLERLRTDKDGVVSFEYVIVAARSALSQPLSLPPPDTAVRLRRGRWAGPPPF